jgi:hypothetical protein
MRVRSLLSPLLILPFVLSCDSNSGNVVILTNPAAAKGPISDFGSAVVGGVAWDLATAGVLINGSLGDENDLGLGMVVTLDGDLSSGASFGTAARVIFDEDVEGPIATLSVDPDGEIATLTVLGTTVFAEDRLTVFADSTGGSYAFDDLMIGDVIEVSGLVDENDDVRATRIDKKGALPGTPAVNLSGIVRNLAGSNFEIGPIAAPIAITFDPTGVTTDLQDLPGQMVAPGLPVDVDGVLTGPNAVDARLGLATIALDDDSLIDADSARVEGVITTFNSLADFEVGGQSVDASAANLLPTDPAAFGLGVVVGAVGNLTGGRLFASDLELRGFDVRIEAELAGAVDTLNGIFTLLGIAVETDNATQFEDDVTGAPDDLLALEDLAAGDFLVVRGVETTMNTVRATRVARTDPDDVVLRTFVQNTDGLRTLTLLGAAVDVNGAQFEDENDVAYPVPEQANFFADITIGDLVKIVDRMDGDQSTIDLVDEVDKETPEGSPALPPRFFPGVLPTRSQPSLAASLARLGVFDAPPPADDLQLPSAPSASEPRRDAQDAALPLARREPPMETGPAEQAPELSMADAVRLYFARMSEVAARRDEDAAGATAPPASEATSAD